jgi:hypothetical protein
VSSCSFCAGLFCITVIDHSLLEHSCHVSIFVSRVKVVRLGNNQSRSVSMVRVSLVTWFGMNDLVQIILRCRGDTVTRVMLGWILIIFMMRLHL